LSLINKMLQELDNRRAPHGQPEVAQSRQVEQNVRAVKPGRAISKLFVRVMAAIMIVAVVWVAWVIRQVMPRPMVTDLAYQQAANRARASQQPPAQESARISPPGAPAAPTSPAAPPAPPAVAAPAVTQPAAAAPTAAEASPKVDMLRLATEMATPAPIRAKAAPAPKAPDNQTLAALKPRGQSAKAPEQPAVAAPKPQAASPQPRISSATPDPGRIDKRANANPRQRAETEFQRAMVQVNQGRVAEGMDGLRASLVADPTYEVPRQTFVALMLEAKRTNEAATALQEGLAINPANTGFAVLLARISVERGDLDGALALLRRHETAAQDNAEYHGFVAALYQRRNRHSEAIEHYLAALRLTSSVGAWWVGLGISQEASGRQKEAADSFRRGKATGSLSEQLAVYVERRLKELQ
jgi:MSHA biogenesis protein MshN